MWIKATIVEFKEEYSFLNKGKIYRRQIVHLVTEDRQRLFVELRDKKIDQIRDMKLVCGETANFKIVFKGSDKNSKYFNNIVIKEIKYEWEKN